MGEGCERIVYIHWQDTAIQNIIFKLLVLHGDTKKVSVYKGARRNSIGTNLHGSWSVCLADMTMMDEQMLYGHVVW
jgi:hypothetical protein